VGIPSLSFRQYAFSLGTSSSFHPHTHTPRIFSFVFFISLAPPFSPCRPISRWLGLHRTILSSRTTAWCAFTSWRSAGIKGPTATRPLGTQPLSLSFRRKSNQPPRPVSALRSSLREVCSCGVSRDSNGTLKCFCPRGLHYRAVPLDPRGVFDRPSSQFTSSHTVLASPLGCSSQFSCKLGRLPAGTSEFLLRGPRHSCALRTLVTFSRLRDRFYLLRGFSSPPSKTRVSPWRFCQAARVISEPMVPPTPGVFSFPTLQCTSCYIANPDASAPLWRSLNGNCPGPFILTPCGPLSELS